VAGPGVVGGRVEMRPVKREEGREKRGRQKSKRSEVSGQRSGFLAVGRYRARFGAQKMFGVPPGRWPGLRDDASLARKAIRRKSIGAPGLQGGVRTSRINVDFVTGVSGAVGLSMGDYEKGVFCLVGDAGGDGRAGGDSYGNG